MALKFNNTDIKNVTLNGKELDQIQIPNEQQTIDLLWSRPCKLPSSRSLYVDNVLVGTQQAWRVITQGIYKKRNTDWTVCYLGDDIFTRGTASVTGYIALSGVKHKVIRSDIDRDNVTTISARTVDGWTTLKEDSLPTVNMQSISATFTGEKITFALKSGSYRGNESITSGWKITPQSFIYNKKTYTPKWQARGRLIMHYLDAQDQKQTLEQELIGNSTNTWTLTAEAPVNGLILDAMSKLDHAQNSSSIDFLNAYTGAEEQIRYYSNTFKRPYADTQINLPSVKHGTYSYNLTRGAIGTNLKEQDISNVPLDGTNYTLIKKAYPKDIITIHTNMNVGYATSPANNEQIMIPVHTESILTTIQEKPFYKKVTINDGSGALNYAEVYGYRGAIATAANLTDFDAVFGRATGEDAVIFDNICYQDTIDIALNDLISGYEGCTDERIELNFNNEDYNNSATYNYSIYCLKDPTITSGWRGLIGKTPIDVTITNNNAIAVNMKAKYGTTVKTMKVAANNRWIIRDLPASGNTTVYVTQTASDYVTNTVWHTTPKKPLQDLTFTGITSEANIVKGYHGNNYFDETDSYVSVYNPNNEPLTLKIKYDYQSLDGGGSVTGTGIINKQKVIAKTSTVYIGGGRDKIDDFDGLGWLEVDAVIVTVHITYSLNNSTTKTWSHAYRDYYIDKTGG